MRKNLFDVGNKIIVVTGGRGQLGKQFCRTLLAHGARVASFDIFPDMDNPLENIDEDRFLNIEVDVTHKACLRENLERIKTLWGVPHGLINNAAIDAPPDAPAGENGPFETYPQASLDRIMAVNVKGVFLASQIIGGAMAEKGRGAVINIGSTYGMISPDQSIYEYRRKKDDVFFKPASYSVSKSALLNLTRYLAAYWAPSNVRVNTLTLGGVFNNQDEEFLKAYCKKVPLGRMANQDDYNGAVLFLISDASSYMTGANMVMDGGWTCM